MFSDSEQQVCKLRMNFYEILEEVGLETRSSQF